MPTASSDDPPAPWQGPIIPIAEALQDTTVDAIVAGHTHRVTNTMVGNILVTEGVNAGGSYSVLQLVVPQHDVEWVGGATRIAKTTRAHTAGRHPADHRRGEHSRPRRSATRDRLADGRHPA